MRVTMAFAREIENGCMERAEPKTENSQPFLDFLDFTREYTDTEIFEDYKAEKKKYHKKGIYIEDYNLTPDIPDDYTATVIEYGNKTEIKVSLNRTNGNGLQKIRKLKNNQFLNTETGEIFEGKRNRKRLGSHYLNTTLKNIKYGIENNFQNGKGQFLTLTYNHVMTDHKIAMTDLKRVIEVFRYRKLEYLWVIEPKFSGTWHFHILVKPKCDNHFEIAEKHLKKAWPHGSIYIEPITDVPGLALYLGRLNNRSIDDQEHDSAPDDDFFRLFPEKYTAERRDFYVSGMKIYDKSQGIKMPHPKRMSYGEAKETVKGYKKINKSCKLIRSGNTAGSHVVNAVTYETFQRK